MRDTTPDPPDDLDDVLAPQPAGGSPARLREALFRRTERTLARARFTRRLATAGAG